MVVLYEKHSTGGAYLLLDLKATEALLKAIAL